MNIEGPHAAGKTTLYGATLPAVAPETRRISFRFRCTQRATYVNVTRPATRPKEWGNAPRKGIICAHGQGKQTKAHSIELYEQGVDQLVRANFIVARPLYLDGQSATVGQTKSRERALETSELASRFIEVAELAFGEETDGEEIGGWGHSYGTDSVDRCCGVETVDRVPLNPLFGAMALWSPEVDTEHYSIPESFRHIAVPMMSVTGLLDFARQAGDAVSWRLQPHHYAPTAIERVAFVHRYGHDAAGAVGTPGDDSEHDAATAAAVCDALACFFRATLCKDGVASKYLTKGRQVWGDVLDAYEDCEIGQSATVF